MLTSDAIQQGLSFVISQVAHVESQMWEVKYPDITYPEFVPVDTSANPWAKTVTYFAMDGRGRADWFNPSARDVPLVSMSREQFETSVHMAAIGYDYNIEEINQARLLGHNLSADKAKLCRRAYDETCEAVAYVGDTAKNFTGLINNASVTRVDVPNGASASPLWSSKTPDEILKDVNAALVGIWSTTKTVAMADTLLLPLTQYADIATRRLSGVTPTTILDWILQNNIYTAQTGQRLKIRALRQLAAAGNGGTDRMIAYRRSPEVLKMHIPMPLQFLPPQPDVFRVIVPGMFRLGGVDVRLPAEMRYIDSL